MFTVLSFAELGSWDDVKMNGRAALEEYDEFLKELPDSKRVSDLLEIVNDKHRFFIFFYVRIYTIVYLFAINRTSHLPHRLLRTPL